MQKYLPLLIFSFFLGNLFGQVEGEYEMGCSTPHTPMPEAAQKAYAKAMTEDRIKYRMNGDSVMLPIVIHNLTWNDKDYIPDSFFIELISNANNILANRGDRYDPRGVDTGLRLCLVNVDPNGNLVTGITHQNTKIVLNWDLFDRFVKDYEWDKELYINAYFYGSILGAARVPWDIDHPLNGGFIVGADNIRSDYGLATFMHELGHYLGLYHTFGKTNDNGYCWNGDCLSGGDEVCDTPPQIFKYLQCIDINSCPTDVNVEDENNPLTEDQLDMVNNFMNGGHCTSIFTQGQADRMHWMIQEYRPDLVVDVESRCASCEPLAVDFEKEEEQGVVEKPMNLTVKVFNSEYQYDWYKDNEWIANGEQLQLVVDTPGVAMIRLEVHSLEDENCAIKWNIEKSIAFRCREKAVEVYEPDSYEAGECYTIQIKGIEDLSWSYDLVEGNGEEILFCPEITGIHHLILNYGEGYCERSDTLYLSVYEKDRRERRYFSEQLFFTQDSISAGQMMRIRKKAPNKYVTIGGEYFEDGNNHIDTSVNIIRFWELLSGLRQDWSLHQKWQPHQFDSINMWTIREWNPNMQLDPADFCLDTDGSIYFLAYEGYYKHSTLHGSIIGKINALGEVEWAKRIKIPEVFQFHYKSHAENTMELVDDKLVVAFSDMILEISKEGKVEACKGLFVSLHSIYYHGLTEFGIFYDISPDGIWFQSHINLIDPSAYLAYNDEIYHIYKPSTIVGRIGKGLQTLNYKIYDKPRTRLPDSYRIKAHKKGAVLFLQEDVYPYNEMIARIFMLDDNGEIIWEKTYWMDVNVDTGGRSHETGIYHLENGDIVLLIVQRGGETFTYLRLDDMGNVLERKHYLNNREDTENYGISFPYVNHQPFVEAEDGFLFVTSTTQLPNPRTMIHHIPLNEESFSCNQFDAPFVELDSTLIEVDDVPDIQLLPLEVQLEDVELFVSKSTYQTELWCEETYSLKDYEAKIIDTLDLCPDSLVYRFEICRNSVDNIGNDTTNLLIYSSSPLEQQIYPITEKSIVFQENESCVYYDYTSQSDTTFMIVNTRLDYLTPYTLEASFFDAHEKLEFEYRNNYLLIEGNCQTVSTSDIEPINQLKTYPNPTSKDLHLQLKNGQIEEARLYTLVGQRLIEQSVKSNQASLSLVGFSEGVYLLEVATNTGQRIWEKVLVQKK